MFVTVLQADGTAACLAAAITCASVALADAGIEMLDLVAASSASFINSRIYLDSSTEEESAQNASMMVSYMPSLDETTHTIMNGELDVGAVTRGTEQIMDACSKVYAVMNAALVEAVKERS